MKSQINGILAVALFAAAIVMGGCDYLQNKVPNPYAGQLPGAPEKVTETQLVMQAEAYKDFVVEDTRAKIAELDAKQRSEEAKFQNAVNRISAESALDVAELETAFNMNAATTNQMREALIASSSAAIAASQRAREMAQMQLDQQATFITDLSGVASGVVAGIPGGGLITPALAALAAFFTGKRNGERQGWDESKAAADAERQARDSEFYEALLLGRGIIPNAGNSAGSGVAGSGVATTN